MTEDCPQDLHARIDLQDLPVFAPSPSLWTRIEAMHHVRVGARRRRMARFVAVAAVLVAALALLPRASVTPVATEVVVGQRESAALEQQWHALASASNASRASVIPLRVIDGALQAAYDRGATANELAALWQQRNQALRGLIADAKGAESPDVRLTRI